MGVGVRMSWGEIFCIDPIFGSWVDWGRTNGDGASNGWVVIGGCVERDKAGFPPRRCELWK